MDQHNPNPNPIVDRATNTPGERELGWLFDRSSVHFESGQGGGVRVGGQGVCVGWVRVGVKVTFELVSKLLQSDNTSICLKGGNCSYLHAAAG